MVRNAGSLKSRTTLLEPEACAKLNLPFAIEIGRIDIERRSKFCLASLEPGEEIQAGQTAARGS
jgi:hypothetical protein